LFAIRWARPLANHDTQLVGLLLQLAHPLHLLGQIATDFRDLAFNGIHQFGESWPPLSPPLDTYGLRHGIPSALFKIEHTHRGSRTSIEI